MEKRRQAWKGRTLRDSKTFTDVLEEYRWSLEEPLCLAWRLCLWQNPRSLTGKLLRWRAIYLAYVGRGLARGPLPAFRHLPQTSAGEVLPILRRLHRMEVLV